MTEVEMQKKALEAAGNWKKFDSFCWYDQPEDAQNWCIVHTCHRDSSLLETNRGRALERSLEKFSEGKDPSVIITRFTHWAAGWVDAIAVKVFEDDNRTVLTPAFKELCRVTAEFDEYD